MSTILVVKCIKGTKDNISQFDFNGFYEGESIQSIVLTSNRLRFYWDYTYMISIGDIVVRDKILYGAVLKRKEIK